MWHDISAPDFFAGIFNGSEKVDPFFDIMPGGIFGHSLDRFHCQFLRGHTRRLGDAECGFKAGKSGGNWRVKCGFRTKRHCGLTDGRISPRERREILDLYRAGLNGYTYFES